jgi:lysophospholipase L1-like esterase
MLDILNKQKIKVVLVGIHQEFLSNYEKMYQDLAREKGVAGYVPGILSGLYQHAQYMFNDFHPNAAGYQIVAERIEPVLRRVLIKR